jgi:dTDP-4-amino-4,6-dideoxygalactose transaminase
MHPFAAAVARQQLRGLDQRNALIAANNRQLNQHLCQLPGLTEPVCRPDQKRVYYNGNMLMFDEKKAGCPREPLIKALKAEGVRAAYWDYPEQHKLAIYSEAKWWHHPPTIPAAMPGTEQVNRGHIFLPSFCGEAADLNAQYAKAFEKVWAHRQELAKS